MIFIMGTTGKCDHTYRFLNVRHQNNNKVWRQHSALCVIGVKKRVVALPGYPVTLSRYKACYETMVCQWLDSAKRTVSHMRRRQNIKTKISSCSIAVGTWKTDGDTDIKRLILVARLCYNEIVWTTELGT